MNPTLLLRHLAVGVFALLAAFGSSALVLGRSQGVALIGRPLDLGVQVGVDAGGDPSGPCLEADVFYGDTRVDPGRVSARLETASGSNQLVRVRSTIAVDEPVVIVYLRVGCGQAVTRRYVLLAEQPGEEPAQPAASARQSTRAAAVAVSVVAVPANAQAGPTGKGQSRAPKQQRATRSSPTTTTTEGSPPRESATLPAVASVRKAAKTAALQQAARLKLDPVDLAIEYDPHLKISTSLGSQAEATQQRRAEALALWQAVNARPEDVLGSIQRVQALENDLKATREALQKDRASLADVGTQLEKAQGERYLNALVFALLLLLLAAVAAAIYAWRQGLRRPEAGRDWWRGGAAVRGGGAAVQSARPAPPKEAAVAQQPAAAEFDLSFSESALDRLQARGPAAQKRPGPRGPRGDSDFAASQPASMRSVKAEEVHDVQQQADFFVSLGEYDRAIDVLRSHINVYPGTSAVAWLDLLEIFHKLQRREEYEATRDEFESAFNAHAPSFDDYQEQRRGLDSYPLALSRVVALWPDPKVLEVIEESIFRKPGRQGGEAFGLEAYRELLLLHNIGKEVIDGADFEPSQSSQPSGFSRTAIEPLSADMSGGPVSRWGQSDLGLPSIGLDINLEEPPPPKSAFMELGGGDARPVQHSSMLDFDLPDANTAPLAPAKPPRSGS
jgi:hypothetical protein